MTGQPTSNAQRLALTSVVASGLPQSIGAEGADRFYVVPAVFNRRPTAAEIAEISGPGTHARLSRAGYPDVSLRVEDRRLLIGNTNLGQLERGLAMSIANAIDEISETALEELRRKRESSDEAERARLAQARDVTLAAERIKFVPDRPLVPASSDVR
ncbi:hypothetical protein DEJ23_09610 [Curtobacterium sp. MCSS17_008]|uniref:hypothetical protein n=1 Tax=Curtobacterium sp. MCSS17_008 TaxID=2175647 RepID=UPI000DA8FE42|nr:hypothetical protein [Curtobacterium sp. MCSS17_008]PZF56791.1 hypothetical protein DEJ23_09610 [Curtobacterium sp. MCSS17_008]